MNSVCVVMDKDMTIGEVMENINPAEFGLKAEFVAEFNEFVFSGEMTDGEFDHMFTGIKMCPMTNFYEVYKNGAKVW